MPPWAHMGPIWGPMWSPYGAHMGPHGLHGPWPMGLEDPPMGVYFRARGRWGPMGVYFRARGRWGPMGSMGLGDPPMGVSSSKYPPSDSGGRNGTREQWLSLPARGCLVSDWHLEPRKDELGHLEPWLRVLCISPYRARTTAHSSTGVRTR